MDLRSVLLEIHAALRDAGIAHALIGGLAMAAHMAAHAPPWISTCSPRGDERTTSIESCSSAATRASTATRSWPTTPETAGNAVA
jgi:hypothetical protein